MKPGPLRRSPLSPSTERNIGGKGRLIYRGRQRDGGQGKVKRAPKLVCPPSPHGNLVAPLGEMTTRGRCKHFYYSVVQQHGELKHVLVLLRREPAVLHESYVGPGGGERERESALVVHPIATRLGVSTQSKRRCGVSPVLLELVLV